MSAEISENEVLEINSLFPNQGIPKLSGTLLTTNFLHKRNNSQPNLAHSINYKLSNQVSRPNLPKLRRNKPKEETSSGFFITQKRSKSTERQHNFPMFKFYPKTVKIERKKDEEKEKFDEVNMPTLDTKDFANKMLYSSFEDEKSLTHLVGKEGLKDFYEIYKLEEKMLKKHEGSDNMGTASLKYLNQAHKMCLIPQNMGLVNNYEKAKLSIPNYSMGDKYAVALSTGLDQAKLQNFELHLNRLSNKGGLAILQSLPLVTRILDLSNNHLSLPSYKKLAEILSSPTFHITELNLEKNNGRDRGCEFISNALHHNRHLEFLNLSCNNITNRGAMYLSTMLEINSKLEILFLHWNTIQGKGGISLAQSLTINNTLQIFDASFNSFGILKLNKNAIEWKNMFIENDTIVHIDLSYNSFGAAACEYLREGLKANHSILGIHFLGNHANIDPQGYMYIQKPIKPSISQIFCRIKQKLELGVIQNKGQFRVVSNCWICEGWREMKFEYISGSTSSEILGEYDNIYMHFSFEDYVPDLMEIPHNPEMRYLVRMIPPGICKYFYSINGTPIIDANYPSEPLKYVINTLSQPKKAEESEVSNSKKELNEKSQNLIQIASTNCLNNNFMSKQIINQKFIDNMKCIPRPYTKTKIEAKKAQHVENPIWSLPISLFWGYIPDNDNILNKCFEFDWSCTRIPRFVKDKNEQAQIKEIIRPIYRVIRESYKYYSAVDSSMAALGLGQNTITEMFANCCKIINEGYYLKDLDLDFIQTISAGGKKRALTGNSDKCLCRFELLELIIRISIRKFQINGTAKTIVEAVERLINEYYLPTFDTEFFNCHYWRITNLWNEESDLALKKHKTLLKDLYANYSGRLTAPGNQKYVSKEEFTDMIVSTGIIDENFGAREISIQFNLSMMTQINEIARKRHLHMFQKEFLEAICRVAEKIAIPSPYEIEPTLTPKELMQQSIHIKINNLLERLLLTLNKDYIRRYEKRVMKIVPLVPTIRLFTDKLSRNSSIGAIPSSARSSREVINKKNAK